MKYAMVYMGAPERMQQILALIVLISMIINLIE